MILKSHLGGAAAVAALMLAAAPGFAQTSSSSSPSSPPPYSSSSPSSQSAPSGTEQMQQNNQYPAGKPSSSTSTMGAGSATNTAATVPLSQVQNPSTTLASAQVQDSSGQSVGQVQKIETGASGRVSKVDVTLSTTNGNGKTVSIPAHDLRFDQSGNILKARLTQSEIEKLEGTSSTTNPM